MCCSHDRGQKCKSCWPTVDTSTHISLTRAHHTSKPKSVRALTMHGLRKLQRVCILRGTQMSRSTAHLHTKHLASLQWGRQEVPAKFNFASDVMDHWASMEKAGKRSPGPALWWVSGDGVEVKWSFSQLNELSQKAANVLSGVCGLQRGDHVAVMLPQVPEWWLVTLGCMRAGLVFMPGTVQMKAKDILHRLQVTKARAILAGDEVAQEVDTVAPDCPSLKTKLLVSGKSRDGWLDFKTLLQEASTAHRCVKSGSQEAAAIYFTSGATGLPKMVEHSHSSLGIKAKMEAGAWVDLRASDIIWTISDTAWILNILTSFLQPWISGACTFVHLLPKFDPAVILKVLSSYPINNMVAPPIIYQTLLQQDISSYKFPHLQNCFSGGETLRPDILKSWRAHTGLDIREFYGQTETGLICKVSKTMKIKPGYLGTAIPHYDVQVIDGEGNVLPPGAEGDLAIRVKPIRPVGICSGYVDNMEKTAANIRGDFWVLGDRGLKDEDGYFQFLGRADDIINSSGVFFRYQIGPLEVENALMEHPAVVETAVISSPDPVQGEVVKAFVVLAPQFLSHDKDQLTKELQQHVKSVTAPFKYPRKGDDLGVLQALSSLTGSLQLQDLLTLEQVL
ncbi:acyl-coenzyme A synthetase ACSM2B, mitochondrial isoform X3 [Manis javanica]|uniref:acyl-coenzyme A synthetase ACSM2B, mitochondrial isoform X3 n=1 Tax=Manis javanica TaxID=9974 RepID=UPI00187A361E|nr:acyl-coenzyme A synthetase ACSM2B, mitochondrial isoform X3 [Manis javanica]